MSTSYTGKLARINLTTGKISTEALNMENAIKFIGGRGLGTKMLYDEGVATVVPLSEKNKLIYLTGALTGTQVTYSWTLHGHNKIPSHRHDSLLELWWRMGRS